MASTSWLFPSSAVDMADDYNGVLYRNSMNAANTMAEDNAFASLISGKNNQFENAPMRAFGFSLASVPAGATITGFEMRMSCYALAPSQFDTAVSDSLVRPLIHSGRTTYQNVNTGAAIAKADQIGQNLASSTLWPTAAPANKAFRTYGGPTNMWGVSEAQLRNPNFGFDLLLAGGGKNGATGYVDSFQLRVHYEGGAPAGPEPITGTGSGTVSGPTGSATGTSILKVTRTPHASGYSAAASEATYTVAREGTGPGLYVSEFRWIGQYRASASGPYDVNQVMLAFDTSTLPAKAITSAKLVLPVAERYGSAVVEARRFDWIAGTSFIPGSQLANHPLLGSATVTGTSVEIPLTGLNRDDLFKIVLSAQAQRLNVAPTGDDTFRLASGEYLEVTMGNDIVVIIGSSAATAPGPNGLANGVSKITGVASGTVSGASGTISARQRLFGTAATVIPAPTASGEASLAIVGQGDGSTVAPTGSSTGALSLPGYGAGENVSFDGLANGGSKISGSSAGVVIAATALGSATSSIRGVATGSISGPSATGAGTSVPPNANGVGFGQSDGPTGLASGKLSIKGLATVTATVPAGSANGRSKIRGTATATISAPSATALGKMGERGTASGLIVSPTGSANGRVTLKGNGSAATEAPTATGEASMNMAGSVATVIVGPWANSTGSTKIAGQGSATIGAPSANATGTSILVGQEGTGQGLISAPTGEASGTMAITGQASATIPAPSAAVTTKVFIRGVAVIQIAGPTASANGPSKITGEGGFTIPAPAGEASGTSILVPRVGVGHGYAEGPSGEALGTLAFTGQGNVTAMAPTASVAASSAIVGQASATIPAPTGEASGAIREAGEGVGENAGFIGQGEGDSVILPIFGQGFGMMDGPSGEALATLVIRGEMTGLIPSPTASAAGYSWLMEALPGTSISAEFDGRALAADNDDRSLSADLDLRSAG